MAETLGGAAGVAVPTIGVGSLIVLLVGYIMRGMAADRSDYRDKITDARTQLAGERERADLAQLEVDQELRQRREAERRAAAAEAELEAQRSLLAWYAAEMDRLRRNLPPGAPPPQDTGG